MNKFSISAQGLHEKHLMIEFKTLLYFCLLNLRNTFPNVSTCKTSKFDFCQSLYKVSRTRATVLNKLIINSNKSVHVIITFCLHHQQLHNYRNCADIKTIYLKYIFMK
ncbi:Protein of unknown function [Gryllus bimaculatus]|nr:Protein of unknown function [Gryllus bimaculatus]